MATCKACDGKGRVVVESVYGYSPEYGPCDGCSGTGNVPNSAQPTTKWVPGLPVFHLCCAIGCDRPATVRIDGPDQYTTSFACNDHRDDLEADGSMTTFLNANMARRNEPQRPAGGVSTTERVSVFDTPGVKFWVFDRAFQDRGTFDTVAEAKDHAAALIVAAEGALGVSWVRVGEQLHSDTTPRDPGDRPAESWCIVAVVHPGMTPPGPPPLSNGTRYEVTTDKVLRAVAKRAAEKKEPVRVKSYLLPPGVEAEITGTQERPPAACIEVSSGCERPAAFVVNWAHGKFRSRACAVHRDLCVAVDRLAVIDTVYAPGTPAQAAVEQGLWPPQDEPAESDAPHVVGPDGPKPPPAAGWVKLELDEGDGADIEFRPLNVVNDRVELVDQVAGFARDVLGAELTPEQVRVVEMMDPDRCRTCFGKGSIEITVPGTEMQDHVSCLICAGTGKVPGGGPEYKFDANWNVYTVPASGRVMTPSPPELEADGITPKPRSYRWEAANPPTANVQNMKRDPVIMDVLTTGVAEWPPLTDAQKELKVRITAKLDEAWYGVPAGVPVVVEQMPRDERRQCVLWISDREVMGWVKLVGRPDPMYVTRPVLTDLPDDAKLHSVRHDWERCAFGFVLESASFDPVPDGDVLPRYGGQFGVVFEAVRLPNMGMAKYPEACIKSTPGGWAVYPADNRDGMVLGMFPLHADAELFLLAVRGY